MQPKAMRYSFMLIRMATIKKNNKIKKQKIGVGEDIEKLEHLCTDSIAIVDNSVAVLQKIKHRITI